MTVPRIYVPQVLQKGDLCGVTPDQVRYLTLVLRMNEGDRLRVFNGSDWEYGAVIRLQQSEKIELEITDRYAAPVPDAHITLCQGIPKAEKMDGIIRHATELGVERILPFFAERTVPRWRPDQLPRRRQRWQKIAIEASRQCGRSDIPGIGEIVSFEQMLRTLPETGLRLIPWEEEMATGLYSVLRDPAWLQTRSFVLAIGPEGGFSAEEIALARQAAFLSVSLGSRILRVETASLALLAVLQYEIGGREKKSGG